MAVSQQTAVINVRVTDGLGIQTNMAGKYRCQDLLAPGNIEGYCESNLTFSCHSFCGATAARHDVGVFLAH